ncbi:MAG TPA: FAD-binding oxidoreductase [Pseudonocardiaceae bacterium]|jgi:alkyldihydroxyacetonephosphate synthase|nr:FAD-binding oxidoreductase [Pseudonocardiaceae bacterium]
MTEPIAHTLRGAWTADTHPLGSKVLRRLRARTGLRDVRTPAVPEAELVVADSALPAAASAALAGVVGAEHVLVDREARLGRAGGLSYLDLLRYRTGAGLVVPDAVVLPGDPAEVDSVVRACARLGVGVVPFGGGTSVVGGVAPLRGDKTAVVAVDLVRLNRLVMVDPVSRLAVLQAGMRGPDAERLLRERGFTLGHYPQSFERATIGGFAATRSAGQASSGYGRFEDMVTGLRLATPRGEWRLGVAPASAAGPDLRSAVVGSEGAFGIVTEVTVRVRPAPKHRRYEAYVFDGWQRGVAAVRELAQGDALATVTRLSDQDETDVALMSAGGPAEAAVRGYLRARRVREPCLLVLGWETGSAAELRRTRSRTRRVLRAARPVALGRRPGESWLKGRFGGPRQRDALLDVGGCVETLETAGYWSALGALRDRVRAALREALPGAIAMCHISHAYETGASLYFTVLAARDENAISQWHRAKDAASRAIVAEPAGTITHHHGVGVDHKPYLEAEIGDLGADVLAAIKQTVDPTGIMNPGKLIPADGDAE